MDIGPDQSLLVPLGPVTLNATIIYSWAVMALLGIGSWLIARKAVARPRLTPGRNFLEAIVEMTVGQISEITDEDAEPFLPFVGTLFLFIVACNALDVVPLFEAPTSSINTTLALATCVFFAVHVYGVSRKGLPGYLKSYLKPTPIMLPFNIIGELSRTLALAVRLFGNMMSGSMTVGILLSLTPLFFPLVMQFFGLIVGVIQAYIFAILAMVYIASAVRTQRGTDPDKETSPEAAA